MLVFLEPPLNPSSLPQEQHEEAEKARERWEIENAPDVEKQEMVDIYIKKGFTEDQAREVVELLFPYRDAFLNVMMIEELGSSLLLLLFFVADRPRRVRHGRCQLTCCARCVTWQGSCRRQMRRKSKHPAVVRRGRVLW